MHRDYKDIRKRIPTPPLWFDEHAVPRYEPFAPAWIANIYAEECVLLRIHCQSCDAVFDVCLSTSPMDKIRFQMTYGNAWVSLAAQAAQRELEYGDPPNVECCASGPVMSSVAIRVLEFWRRGDGWQRVPELEIDQEAPWASDTPATPTTPE